MSRPRQFSVEYDDLVKAFEGYKQDVIENDHIPDYADFLSMIGSYPDEVKDVLESPNNKNDRLIPEIKKIMCWFIAQYSVNHHWRGQNKVTAIWLQKQLGYTDKTENKADGPIQIEVKFGGVKDPFG